MRHSFGIVGTIAISIMAIGMLVWPMAFASDQEASQESRCETDGDGNPIIPDEVRLANGSIVFKRNSDPMPLEHIDLFTKIRWSLSLLVPGLTWGEIGIYLYPLPGYFETDEEGKDVNDVTSARYVKFFIACSFSEDTYLARAGTVSAANEVNNTTWSGFLGMTVSVPEKSLKDTVKAQVF